MARNYKRRNYSPSRQKRIKMLNMRKVGGFKYDIREILSDSKMDAEATPSFIANVIAKASRVSIQDAKEYARELESKGMYSKDIADNICGLLDRYSRYR